MKKGRSVVAFTTKRILKWVGLTLLIAIGAILVLAGVGVLLYFIGPVLGKWALSQWSGLVVGMLMMAAVFTVVMGVLENKTRREKPITQTESHQLRRMPESRRSKASVAVEEAEEYEVSGE